MSTADDKAINGSIDEMTKVFIEKYRDKWNWMPDIRLLGIAIVYRFMINDRVKDMLLSAFFPAIVPRCDPATLQGSDRDLLDRLRNHIAFHGRKRQMV
jgi:hypothetical protein